MMTATQNNRKDEDCENAVGCTVGKKIKKKIKKKH
jgi:hypothetical protein